MAKGITGPHGYRSADGKVNMQMMVDAYKEVIRHADEIDLTRLELYLYGTDNLPVFMDGRDAQAIAKGSDLVQILNVQQLWPIIENNQRYHSLTPDEVAHQLMNAVPYEHRGTY